VTCLNISSIVDTAQVIDTVVGHWLAGGTGAIEILFFQDDYPVMRWVRWDFASCSQEMLLDGDCVPFVDTDGMLFSVGFVAVLFILVPLARMDLKVRRRRRPLAEFC
jgi:hypothetical protein